MPWSRYGAERKEGFEAAVCSQTTQREFPAWSPAAFLLSQSWQHRRTGKQPGFQPKTVSCDCQWELKNKWRLCCSLHAVGQCFSEVLKVIKALEYFYHFFFFSPTIILFPEEGNLFLLFLPLGFPWAVRCLCQKAAEPRRGPLLSWWSGGPSSCAKSWSLERYTLEFIGYQTFRGDLNWAELLPEVKDSCN